ncbi:MAG: glycogen/starch/alpha-glucan phosphorylase [Parachlamydiales bacterium]
MNSELELKVNILAEKIKHYLVTHTDKLLDEASDQEFYQAFCHALREEVMVNWAATRRMAQEKNKRTLYYLSMEYLPGRITGNNLTNLKAHELVGRVLHKMGRNLAEITACEHDPGLGNGGLGRLASCFLDSLATLHYPAMGYGLRYQYGIFDQEIWDGVQIERPDPWLLIDSPWHDRRDFAATSVQFCGRAIERTNSHGDTVFDLDEFEEVRAIPYDTPIVGYTDNHNFTVIPLRLWTTKESPRNFQLQRYNAGRLDQAAENTTLTDVLYPSDHHDWGKRIRLKQEALLSSASAQDIIRHYLERHENFDHFADKVRIQINDTHPAIAIAELMRLLTGVHDVEWRRAWEMTQSVISFTNHTVLKEALEEWERNLFHYLLPRQYRIIERINDEFCNDLRRRFPGDDGKIARLSILEDGKVRMANLAVHGSHHINGVAKLHTSILTKTVFRDFYDLYPERFVNVTNGVTPRRWLLHSNPELATFITERIGEKWVTDLSELRNLANFAGDRASQEAFLAIKRRNKERLCKLLAADNPVRDLSGKPIGTHPDIDPASLFDVQIKRIHEYKRQLMNALHAIMIYQELKENPQARTVKRTVMVGGKAAAGYRMAKNIIRLIHCIGRKVNTDPEVNGKLRVLFIENYNVSKAQVIIPATDLSEQISTAGMEASGTGNMKLSMNGALTIGTDDGANVEMRTEVGDRWWPFLFGASTDEIDELRRRQDDSALHTYSNNPAIYRAVNALKDRTFAQSEDEHGTFSEIASSLLEGQYGMPADRYFVLKDLPAYYDAQKRVEALYERPLEWAEYALHNIAGMGYFSTDRAIREYAEKIWRIEPCPLDDAEVEHIRAEYAEHVPTLIL